MTEPTPSPASVRLAPGVYLDSGRLTYLTSRSSGPGGQNVNKRETKVELRVAIGDIPLRTDARARLARLAGERLTKDGVLQLVCEQTRSQRQNRGLVLARLCELVAKAQRPPIKRIRTKPTKGSIRRRLDEKTRRSKRKDDRKRNKDGDLPE